VAETADTSEMNDVHVEP